MRILFTSASNPTALALARVLKAEGHTIHAVEKEEVWGSAPARYSRAYRRFHRLTGSYGLAELWKEVGSQVDLVVPFGPIPRHVAENIRRGGANLVGETLTHDDYDFQDFVRATVIDNAGDTPSVVKVPASFTVTSQACIAEILSCRSTSTFSLQPQPYYESDDEDTLVEVGPPAASSLDLGLDKPLIISFSTLSDRTVEAIKRLPISNTKPYRLVEAAKGGSFYSAHAFIHSGQIRTFVVTTGCATNKDFVLVPPTQLLFEVLYEFTMRLVEALDSWQSVVANHLSLTFHVKDEVKSNGDFLRRVTVTSCHNQPHASLILLATVPALRHQLSLAYTSPTDRDVFPILLSADADAPKAIYSLSLAAAELAHILYAFRPWRWDRWARLAHMSMMCWVWVINFKEEWWDWHDPGPALCLWASMFISKLFGYPRRLYQLQRVLKRFGRRASVYLKLLIPTQIVRALALFLLGIWRFWMGMLGHGETGKLKVLS